MAREKAQEIYNRDVRSAERLAKATSAAKKAYLKKKWKTGGKSWSPQRRNEEGNCKEQTLAKIKHLAKVNGGVVRIEDFEREYGNIGTVKHWFGSWDKGVKAAGLETYLSRVKRTYRERKNNVPKLIHSFYKQHGRTPQSSDFNGDNDLPSHKTVISMFGSLNNARSIAKVPLLVWVPGMGWKEILTQEISK